MLDLQLQGKMPVNLNGKLPTPEPVKPPISKKQLKKAVKAAANALAAAPPVQQQQYPPSQSVYPGKTPPPLAHSFHAVNFQMLK